VGLAETSETFKSAERFAVRFAAREALYKALSYAYPHYSFPFLTLCKNIAITKTDNRPYLAIIDDIGVDCNGLTFHISLSHTLGYGMAFIIIERGMV